MSLRNEIIEVFKSLARTANPTLFELASNQHEACIIVIDCTAVTATPSVVFTLYGVDPASGKEWVILASAAITGTGTTLLRVGRGLTAAANVVANDMLPPKIRLKAVHGDADSITYSVGLHLISLR